MQWQFVLVKLERGFNLAPWQDCEEVGGGEDPQHEGDHGGSREIG